MSVGNGNSDSIMDFKEMSRAPRRGYWHPIGVMIRGRYEICDALILSENGILFVAPRVVPMGAVMLCTLIMPGGASIVVKSRVVFSRQVGNQLQLGASFMNLEIESRRKVRGYVASKTTAEVLDENSARRPSALPA